MDLTHLHAFTAAMQRKDLDAMFSHMADDVVLKTPLHTESFAGKRAMRPVVEALLAVVDRFEFREILQGSQHVSAVFGVYVGSDVLDGIDLWRLNEAGEIQEMTVFWRPLPTIVSVQAKLAHA